jgi:hypothetical protein
LTRNQGNRGRLSDHGSLLQSIPSLAAGWYAMSLGAVVTRGLDHRKSNLSDLRTFKVPNSGKPEFGGPSSC